MTLLTFQSYPGGVDESAVISWPVSGHVIPHASGGPNNQPWGHFAGDSTTFQSGQTLMRLHDWGFKSGQAAFLQPGQIAWRCIAMRAPSGQTAADTSLFAGDEVHQSSSYGTTGPAPVNHSHDGFGSNWYYLVRGQNNRGLAGDAFNQTRWGRTSDGAAFHPFTGVTGGLIPVVADRWTYWLTGVLWSYTGAGWVEQYYRDSTLSDWVNVIPRFTNIYTCYNNSMFPMSSVYAANLSGTRAMDFSIGAFADNFTEALNYINAGAGFTGTSGGSTVVAAPGAPSQVGVATVDTAVATVVGDDTNQKRGTPSPAVVPNDAGTVTKGYEYGAVVSPATSTLRKMAVYLMDGSPAGTPGTLLGVSDEMTFASQTAGWVAYNFSTPIDLSPYRGQTILIATITPDSAKWNTYKTSVAQKEFLRIDVYATGPTNPWSASVGGGFTGTYDNQLCLCVSYTPAGAAAAPLAILGTATGSVAQIRFDTPLDPNSIPPASAFAFTIGGVSYMAPDRLVLSADGLTLTMSLPKYLASTDTVTGTYTQPASQPLQDAATGLLPVVGFTISVTNQTPILIPRFHQAGARRAFVGGARISSPSSRIAGRGGGGV